EMGMAGRLSAQVAPGTGLSTQQGP
ncbi:hypothetical protein PANDA_006938, partial [Ailuropoda melanoleuca]